MLDFIRRERIYFLMLIFILTFTALNTGAAHKASHEESFIEEDAFSNKTFKELGISEERVMDYLGSKSMSARFFRFFIPFGFFIFLLSLVMDIAFVFRRKRLDSWFTQEHVPSVSWGVLDLVRASIVILFTGYILAILQGMLFEILDFKLGEDLMMMVNTFFIDMAVGIIVLYFVAVRYKDRLQALGLRSSSFFNNVFSGIAAYIFVLPVLLIILVLSVWILNLVGYTPPPQPVFEIFMKEDRSRVLLFLTILVSVLGPIIEEIFFRGFMYAAVKKHLGVLGAAFLSAAVFSALHTNIVGFFPIMALGLLLAFLYERTGSLVGSITVHIVHNSIILGFVFFIKELLV